MNSMSRSGSAWHQQVGPRHRTLIATLVLVALTITGCSTGTHAAGNTSGSNESANQPSPQARLACGLDAESDVVTALGVGPTQPLAPTWVNGVYSCRYVFANGVMVLSVEDHPNPTTALAAFTKSQGTAETVPAVGQHAYALATGTLVVHKDDQVMTIDVSGMPPTFGMPPHPRNIDAITVADAILACWTEDS